MMRDEDKTKGQFVAELGRLRRRIRQLEASEEKRRRADEVQQESEHRYRELFRHISSGVAVYQATAEGRDFIIRDLNRAGQRISKVKKEEIVGRSVLEVFPGVKEFGLFDVFQKVWRTGESQRHPVSLYADDHLSHWAENYVYKLPSGEIVAVYDDVTERKRAESALQEAYDELEQRVEDRTAELSKANEQLQREIEERKEAEVTLQASEARYRLLLEASPDPIVVYDMDGRATYVNPAFEQSFGWSDEELLHKRIDYVPAENLPETKTAIQRMLEGEKIQSFETRRLTKDGRVLDIHLSSSLFLGQDGEPAGNIVILRDVTARRRMEETLEQMRSKLINLQESELRNIARILHDTIGQNISVLDFNLTTIEELLDEASREIVAELHANMRQVIRDSGDKLRDIASGLHPREVQELGLVEGVTSFIERFRRRTKHAVHTNIQIEGLQTEENLAINVYRIIQEAFTNVFKHAKCQTVDFQMIADQGRLWVRVKDDGIGFIPADISDREIDQRGMGLFIIQERVKAINGILRINSEPNQGTELQLEAPLVHS
jgi:PAS domain S-box-containing protein